MVSPETCNLCCCVTVAAGCRQEKWQAKRNRKRLKSDSETLLHVVRGHTHISARDRASSSERLNCFGRNPFNLSLKKALACRRSSAAISSWCLYFFNSIPRRFYLLWDHYFD